MTDGRGPYNSFAFVGDRVTVYGPVTLPDGETLTGSTLQFRGYDASGALAWDSDAASATASATSSTAYTAGVPTAGLSAGVYRWQVRRTDSGHEGVLVFGNLTLRAIPPR